MNKNWLNDTTMFYLGKEELTSSILKIVICTLEILKKLVLKLELLNLKTMKFLMILIIKIKKF